MPRRLKIPLLKSNVVSVLLYGSGTWKVTEAIKSKLQVFVNRCLRVILRIFWPNRISNEKLLQIAEMPLIEEVIKQQKWEWIGHTLRKSDGTVCKQALDWNPPTSIGRAVGRPCGTWKRTVQNEAMSIGKTWK